MRPAIELTACLLLAALFIETWLVKGIVVPCPVVGGSMAETLLGDHETVVCADCGYRFNRGVDRSPRSKAVCPNCGYADNELKEAICHEGERLLIDRAAFALRPPRRWEVAAFRQPDRADAIAVKRIVGLPGESVEIRGGDVYIDGHIRRKNLEQQRALAVPVHSAAYRPTSDPTLSPGWRAEGRRLGTGIASGTRESRWKWTDGRFSHPIGAQDDPIDWLVYRHGRRGQGKFIDSPVADLYGYNQSRPRREEDVHAVADLMLSFRLVRESGQGTVFVRATDGGERFEALMRMEADKLRYEVYRDGNPVPGAAGETRNAADRLPIEVSLIDRQFLLAIDGRTVVCQPIDQTDPPPAPTATPLAIGVQGLGASIDELRVYRDVYYTAPIGFSPPGVVKLGSDEYFVLGDNSPVSEDSRRWPDGGAVEANLLVGKPLAAISPEQFPPRFRTGF